AKWVAFKGDLSGKAFWACHWQTGNYPLGVSVKNLGVREKSGTLKTTGNHKFGWLQGLRN
ncbi:MAG: hypothetical protein WBV48_01085, partial [Candidatus Acidiferrales bacterium]